MTERPTERPKEFEVAVKASLPRLNKLARRYSNSREDAEDVVQDVLLWATSNWGEYDRSLSFVGWVSLNLRSLARNRRRRAYNSMEHVSIEDAALIEQPTQNTDVEAVRLAAAVCSLPDDQARAIAMYASGYTQTEIGECYGAGKARGQWLLRQGRARLRKVAA